MVKIDFTKRRFGVEKEFTLEVNLSIKQGEFVAVTGPSGSGKTSLLRILAGLEDAQGVIEVEGREWLGKSFLPPQKREVGFVFQDYALFENMSVIENLLFVSKDRELAEYLLKTTELIELKGRFPNTLSGGQKQRVALCRALMRRPKLLLMDEPLSALDNKIRFKLQDEIKALHKEFKMTTVMVSHDFAEIFRLSNRVLRLENGKVVEDKNTHSLKNNNPKFLAQVVEVKKESAFVLFCGDIFEIKNRDFRVGDEVELFLSFE